ncbi:MAG: sulfotransferase [Chromatiaceae bacterium]|nr:sulfotransferase [Chromatiaceae bacterium]
MSAQPGQGPHATPGAGRPLDFLIAGPQGTGEQWLATRLRGHPGVDLPLPPLPYQISGSATEAHLVLALAPGTAPAPGILRGYADYHFATLDSTRIERLVAQAPALRLVLTWRAPQERLLMAAVAAIRAAHLGPDEVTPAWLTDWRNSRFQHQQGDYRGILRTWRRWLSPAQVHWLRFEDLRHHPERALDACCRFLGLTPGLLDPCPYDYLAEQAQLERLLPPGPARQALA